MRINTILPKQAVEKMIDADINLLWDNFRLLEGDKEFEKLKMQVRDGVNIKFDISRIIENNYKEYPPFNNANVDGVGIMDLIEFRREKEERVDLMRTAFYWMLENIDMYKARGKDDD